MRVNLLWMKRVAGIGLILMTGASAQAASFDCGKVLTKVEEMICFTSDLSVLDEQLANSYNAILEQANEPEKLRAAQKGWLKTRNRCTNNDCVKHAYETRLHELASHYEDLNKQHYTFCDRNNRGLYCEGQTGKGYSVCEVYLKHLRTLDESPTCKAPVPPGFKHPEWEEMDVMQHLDLAYQAEGLFYKKFDGSYKHPDFDTWRQAFLKEIQTDKIEPRMRKARLKPNDKGEATILAYTRDRSSCRKTYTSEERRSTKFKQQLAPSGLLWAGQGDAHFILTDDSPAVLQAISGWGGSTSQTDLMLYARRPYLVWVEDSFAPIYKGLGGNLTFKTGLSAVTIWAFDPRFPDRTRPDLTLLNTYTVDKRCQFKPY